VKIQELNLAAFGPFTDRKLVFDLETCGLHIVYGPNEAGKSSALRGLKALLYGVEERTSDNFLHANDKLRIYGCLRNTDGHDLAFVRRKGRRRTLLTLDGEEIDEQVLATFLQGVTRDLFETLFGIDHQALHQGGQEILAQKGDVGQALFSAALGSHTLHAVLEQLDDEAKGLFLPAGSRPVINAALKSYAELKKEIRDSSLSSREWDEHRRTLGRTSKKLEEIQFELADLRLEVNRLKRIQRILPKLARRRELLQELTSLDNVVILSDDFADRHQQAVKLLEMAQVILGKAEPRFDGLQKQLESLSISENILEQAENIEDLHARLGGHRKALQDRPHLEAERQQLLTDAESLLKEIRSDLELTDVEKLRPILARRQIITELGGKNAVLVSRVEQAESSKCETETRLKIAFKESHELPETGSSDTLHRTIAAARKLGDMDGAIQSIQSELTTLQQQCAADLSRLPLWDGKLEDLPGLAVPARESIIHFEEVYDSIEQRCQRLREKQDEAKIALSDASLRLDEIQRVGMVPTETDLADARSGRDLVWRLLRRQWVNGEEVSTEERQLDVKGTLPDEFEDRLVDADEVSDRLRREAERVHAMASWLAKQESVQRQMADTAQQIEACTNEKSRIDAEWQALWVPCQVQPRTPREMRVWLDDLEKLRDRVGQLHLLSQRTGELIQTRKTHIQQLKYDLEALGKEGMKFESLETVLLESEGLAMQLDEIKQQRDSLDKEIKGLEADLVSLTDDHRLAMKEFAVWEEQWKTLIEGLGLQGDTSPSNVADFIEKVRELFAKQGEAEKLQIRIKAINEDAESFNSQVASMATSIAPELVETSVDNTVICLNSLLSDNRSKKTRRQQIEEQLDHVQQEIQESRSTIQGMTDRLDSLCKEAECNEHIELKEAERKSARFLELQASIASIEQEILEAGEGANVEALENETKDVDPDGLPGRIELLNNKINDELEPRRTELAQRKGGEKKELELMNGSDQAAVLADQAQAILASIRSDAERYIRVKLAGRVLRDEIERYRKENQGPLVKCASEHFASLTLGSFAGLMTDFNEKDEPVLAGIRPDGERVLVEGMSSGTRDQLYLALRLASLEKYMESSEPMPFIVDDVLVDFDDERSLAALNVLSKLAEETQVILFTHHSQVVEQSKQLKRPPQVLSL
jgi:uncharacterized protein YhaN